MRLHIISNARAMVLMDTTDTRSARGLDLSAPLPLEGGAVRNTEPGSFRRTPRFRARAILPESGNMNLARYARPVVSEVTETRRAPS